MGSVCVSQYVLQLNLLNKLVDNTSDNHFLGIPVYTRTGIWDTQKIRKRTFPFSKILGEKAIILRSQIPHFSEELIHSRKKKFSLVPLYMYICVSLWIIIYLRSHLMSFFRYTRHHHSKVLECQRLNILFQSLKEYYENDIIIAPFQRAKYAYIRVVL